MKCLHDDISGPCVNLLILAPELGRTIPLENPRSQHKMMKHFRLDESVTPILISILLFGLTQPM